MRSLLAPSSFVLVLLSICFGIFLCGLPLFETLGYEYALASALTTALFTGCAAAVLPGRLRRRSLRHPPRLARVYFSALVFGLVIAAAMAIVSLVNGIFFVPFCNLPQGLVFFLLMPVFSATIAAAVGLAAGLLTASSVRAVLLFILLVVVSLGSGLYAFYSTPAVFVFHPFAGYYPGVLYDRIIRPDIRLLTYRIGTLIEVAAVLFSLSTVYNSSTISLSLKKFKPSAGRTKAAFAFVFCAWAFHLFGAVMGHRAEHSTLESHLPRHVSSSHLDLFFPRDADPKLVEALTLDAEFSMHQLSSYFGIEPRHRIFVFVFADAKDKGRVMGAGNTNVAKPWRREVYVALAEPPHPVLRHELAHALSADFGAGPFAVSGKWGGWIPNPALIEGLATAAGGQRGDLTVHQWARAMDAIGLLPRIEQLTGLGFFDLPASAAYTASGSFCDWIKKRFGASTLIDAYRIGDFETATGRTLSSLENEWKTFLSKVSLLEADKAAARARFDRKPVIRTRCVHAAAELCDDARDRLNAGDKTAALELLETAHRKSGRSTETAARLFFAANEIGDWDKVRAEAEKFLDSPQTKEAKKSAISEMLLDLDMSEQKDSPYAAAYAKLAASAETESRRRLLDVKAHLAGTGVTYPEIFDVLSLRPGHRAVTPVRAALIIASEASARPDDPVRAYLLARQFFNVEGWNEALSLLDRAESLGLFSVAPAVRLAARTMRGDALLSLGRYDDAFAVFREVADDSTVREGLRALASDKADRALFYKTAARNSDITGL